MQTKIICHKSGRTYPTPHFFILSKGNNAGRPMTKPCPNCFVFLCNDMAQREQFYWLCYGIWQAGYFRPHINGSVIPFIHIGDLRMVIKSHWANIYATPDQFLKSISALSQLNALHENLLKQVESVKQLKYALAKKALAGTEAHSTEDAK